MLESEIKKLTTAVTELTAAIESKSGSAPSTQGTTKDTAPAEVQAPAPPVVVRVTGASPDGGQPEVVKAEEKVPTKKALVEKFIELAQTKDREVAVKLLADFGVSKLPELTDKSKWAGFIAAVDVLLAA